MGVPGSANFLLAGAQGYQIERSLRFNSADSAYLNRTPASAGNRKTWTWSGWVKKTSVDSSSGRGLFTTDIGSTSDSTFFEIRFGTASYPNSLAVSGYTTNWRITTQVFRDTSAWYHVVAAIDTTQATGADRIKIYVNGVQITAFVTSSDPSLNADLGVNNSASTHNIGRAYYDYLNGYLAEINFIDGQALTPSSFGEINPATGVWQPKRYSGTYGTNGFYLNFADNSGTTSTTLGKDSSGNGNNWTPNNFSVTAGSGNDSLIDTPTPYADGGNGRGNYCTLNPLATNGGTFSNGNLEYVGPTGWRAAPSTFLLPSTGKWYVEGTLKAAPYDSNFISVYAAIGVIAPSAVSAWSSTSGTSFYVGDSGHYANYSTTSSGSFSGNTTGTVLSLAINRDSNEITIYQNGVSKATVTLGITTGAALYVFYGSYDGNYGQMAVNFGQRPFAYTPPAGFLALNTQNLPEPSIKKPSSYMDVVTYTGTGSALTPTTGLGFSPDLVWIKSRSAATDHALYDAVRGAEKRLESNNTDAEVTSDSGVTAFNSAGFTLGTLAQVNTNAATYVAWCWDESATPGFDIVTYTGNGASQNIAHSLGVAPSMIIVKNRPSSVDNWQVWHKSLTANYRLRLNTTDAADLTSPNAWNNTDPTSSVFSVGSQSGTNGLNNAMVAYLWSEVAGFSKFGSYTGNGSSDGPFVFCNFRPRWVMVKSSSNITNWYVFDTVRNEYNLANKSLLPNLSNAENTGGNEELDIVSNGFKMRNASSSFNISGYTYIFAAFAESPFKYSLAR